MTLNLCHLHLAQLCFKEKVGDGTCAVEKVNEERVTLRLVLFKTPKSMDVPEDTASKQWPIFTYIH